MTKDRVVPPSGGRPGPLPCHNRVLHLGWEDENRSSVDPIVLRARLQHKLVAPTLGGQAVQFKLIRVSNASAPSSLGAPRGGKSSPDWRCQILEKTMPCWAWYFPFLSLYQAILELNQETT